MNSMEWLTQVAEEGNAPGFEVLVVRLSLGLVGGLIVAWLYRHTRDGSGAPSLPATLVLMSVLIAAVTQVIGDNVARAFSLVGALSIVRFRTVVRDTRDTAFVIFTVVIGMSVGSGHALVALVALFFTGTAAWLMRPRADATLDELELTVRIGLGQDIEKLAGEIFREHLRSREEVAASTAQKGTALEMGWRVTLSKGASGSDLVRALNRIEGVQDVEIRRVDTER